MCKGAKKPNNDKASFTFNLKRMTSNPLRIDYILPFENLLSKISALKVEIDLKLI